MLHPEDGSICMEVALDCPAHQHIMTISCVCHFHDSIDLVLLVEICLPWIVATQVKLSNLICPLHVHTAFHTVG